MWITHVHRCPTSGLQHVFTAHTALLHRESEICDLRAEKTGLCVTHNLSHPKIKHYKHILCTVKRFLLSLILFIIRFWSSGILKVMNCRRAAIDHRISLAFTSRSQLKYLRPKQTSIEQAVHTLTQTMCCWAIWIIYMRSVYRFIGASGAGRINIQERWPPSAR